MFGDQGRLGQVSEFDLEELDAGGVAVGFEVFVGGVEVFLFFAEQVQGGTVMLKEVGADSEA